LMRNCRGTSGRLRRIKRGIKRGPKAAPAINTLQSDGFQNCRVVFKVGRLRTGRFGAVIPAPQ